jgi:CBS-domain-containing membrane protein
MSSSDEAHDAQQQPLAAVAGQTAPGHGQALRTRYSRHEYEQGSRVADVMVRFPKTHGPGSTLEEIRAFFEDDHVHMALIVARDGSLVTTVERPDLAAALPGSTPARELGTLTGRTAGPADPLDAATGALRRARRRRLAVVDHSGRLLGLLCLQKDEAGYCSDEGIRERAHPARRS